MDKQGKPLLAADNDREMLEYLGESLEGQTYRCEQCGHEEPLQTFDVAVDLRGYLEAYPEARGGRDEDAPAEQHQGEPVALPDRLPVRMPERRNLPKGVPEGWNACLDEIAKLGPLYTRPAQGEPVAWVIDTEDGHGVDYYPGKGLDTLELGTKLYTRPAQGEPAAWALIGAIGGTEIGLDRSELLHDQGKYGGDLVPLYTHADPAEVERLRDQLKSLEIDLKAVTDEHDESLRQLTEMTTERDRLREGLDNANINIANWAKANQSLKAQLVERDALLIKANYVIDHARTIDKQAFAYGSQNVEHGLFRGLGNLLVQYYEALSANAERNQCDGCQAGIPVVNGAHRMGKPGGYSDSMACQAAKYASVEPSAPVERDGLHLHLERMIGQAEYMLELAENSSDPDEDDDGSFNECREYIQKARAALERKP